MLRVTLRDVAKAAGVSQAAVSLALNDRPGVSAKTRERIKALTEEMGYIPDPAFARIAIYRHGGSPTQPYTLGFLSGWNEAHPERSETHCSPKLEGSRDRARKLGWNLEHFFMSSDPQQQRRLSRILFARGIRGLLIAGTLRTPTPPQLDWTQFCTVVLGNSNAPSGLHHCGVNYHQAVSLAVEKLRQRGAHRIGLVINRGLVEWIDYEPFGGFLQTLLKEHQQVIEPIVVDSFEDGRFVDWLQRHQPDTILAGTDKEVAQLRPHVGDTRLAALSTDGEHGMGIIEPLTDVGVAAVDLLHLLLAHDEVGFPTIPRTLLLNCRWTDGRSAS